jgi:outer membrane biosynthesis protein TonB
MVRLMISNARRHDLAPGAAAFLLAGALALSACSSTFDVLPEKVGGLPATAPARAAEPMAFPNVYEVRPTREIKPLTDDEQKKLESELATLREEQKQLANPPPPAPPPAKKAAAPVKKDPAPAKKSAAKEAAPAKKKQNDAVVPEQKGPVAAPKLIN